jgi:hypothetical protein
MSCKVAVRLKPKTEEADETVTCLEDTEVTICVSVKFVDPSTSSIFVLGALLDTGYCVNVRLVQHPTLLINKNDSNEGLYQVRRLVLLEMRGPMLEPTAVRLYLVGRSFVLGLGGQSETYGSLLYRCKLDLISAC